MLNFRLFFDLSVLLERVRAILGVLRQCVGRSEECLDVVESKNL